MKSDDIVKISGIEMTIDTAIQQGFLVKDGSGNLSEGLQYTNPTPIKNGTLREQRQPSEPVASMLTDKPAQFVTLGRMAVGEAGFDQAMGKVMEAAVTGTEDQIIESVKAFASTMGHDDEVMTLTILEAIMDNLADNAIAMIERAYPGVDGEDVFHWLQTEAHPELRSRTWRELYFGRVRGVKQLVENYALNNKR